MCVSDGDGRERDDVGGWDIGLSPPAPTPCSSLGSCQHANPTVGAGMGEGPPECGGLAYGLAHGTEPTPYSPMEPCSHVNPIMVLRRPPANPTAPRPHSSEAPGVSPSNMRSSLCSGIPLLGFWCQEGTDLRIRLQGFCRVPQPVTMGALESHRASDTTAHMVTSGTCHHPLLQELPAPCSPPQIPPTSLLPSPAGKSQCSPLGEAGEKQREEESEAGPWPRCEETAPPPSNLLLARPRDFISWREGAERQQVTALT